VPAAVAAEAAAKLVGSKLVGAIASAKFGVSEVDEGGTGDSRCRACSTAGNESHLTSNSPYKLATRFTSRVRTALRTTWSVIIERPFRARVAFSSISEQAKDAELEVGAYTGQSTMHLRATEPEALLEVG
jgi:hypothetical protein